MLHLKEGTYLSNTTNYINYQSNMVVKIRENWHSYITNLNDAY